MGSSSPLLHLQVPSESRAQWRCTLRASSTEIAEPVCALRLIRKLNKQPAAWLILCDDESLYVVRFSGDPSHPNALANEMLWTALAESVGLPVAPGRPIWVSSSFLEENPSLIFTTSHDSVARPRQGMHYGKRFLGKVSGPARTVEYLLNRDVATVANRSDFLKMYILDVWANSNDSRKAIFLTDSDGRGHHAVFIGSVDLFGSAGFEYATDKARACHWKRSLYSGLWNEKVVHSWGECLRSAIPSALDSTIPQIPNEWHSGNLNAIHASSLSRLNELPTIIEAHSLADESFVQRNNSRR